MVKIIKFSKAYDGLSLNVVHFRYLMLKTNGDDQKR